MLQSNIAPDILIADTLDEHTLAGSLLCINGMRLLNYTLQIGGIPLTKSGGFVRTCVNWAAAEFKWPGFTWEDLYAVNKVLNEMDFPPLSQLHDLMIVARLMRHRAGKAVLTKRGMQIIGLYGELQALLFESYFTRSSLSNYERFQIENFEADYRHIFWLVQNRVDGWVELGEFAKWCVPVDMIVSPRLSPLQEACFYVLANATRPMSWFGLIEQGKEQYSAPISDRVFRRTPLFTTFLKFVSTAHPSYQSH